MHEVDRAIADGEDEGFVKIHVKEGTDRILGATVVARHAGVGHQDGRYYVRQGTPFAIPRLVCP
jgi:pyruvate/2-oxoglutarate dehydrogenase complex dihydrolipoamide dehydrogenase (E3) component